MSSVITISKDFSLNIGATTYTGIPLTGNIHGDGGLIMSVTENGVTRQTALNVVSEITYSFDGSIVYNGATYAAGNFAIDAAGNGIGVVTSADLAGDFLPNYDNDFANALQIVDAGTLDNRLSEILPVNADLGEISFDTQPDKLTKPQIVIAPTK